MHSPESITVERDQRMIPIWSIVLAVLGFVAIEYYFWIVAPGQRHHPPPALGLRIYFNLSWGVMTALYFLMVGYISKDAPRRGMTTRFWMLICFVIPAGIGAVLWLAHGLLGLSHKTQAITWAFPNAYEQLLFLPEAQKVLGGALLFLLWGALCVAGSTLVMIRRDV